ncbi:hypothetical protein LCGC14_3090480, partial [marine sediment metagenome]
LVDDAEFIRQRTGFNYFTPDEGVEVGIEPGPLSLFMSLTNGTQGADENNSGRLVVQEDRHVTMYDTPDPTLRTRTFFVYGYQPEAQS